MFAKQLVEFILKIKRITAFFKPERLKNIFSIAVNRKEYFLFQTKQKKTFAMHQILLNTVTLTNSRTAPQNVDLSAPLSTAAADQSSDSDSFNGLLLSAKHIGM